MKKNFSFIFAAFAAFALLLSCAKEEVDTPVTGGSQNDQQNVVEPVTISATLSDALTKVGFTPSYENGKPVQMALAWEDGDLLRVYNHDDRSKFDDFALDAASIGQKKGNFTGTPVNIQGASMYDVEVVAAEDFSYSSQTQPSDGVTTGLKYLAGVSGVASYSAVEFADFSSVLAVTVKMPEGVAASVKSVDIKASENIFDGSDRLTVTLDQAGDAGEDGIVHFFATLPQGSTVIPSGTTLVAHINVPDTDHTVYTRFVELGSDLSFVENKFNTININATGSANYANASVENIGTEANPYLVGDKYQFDAMRNYISGTMAYFEMIDDIDMTGIAWNPLNTVPANPIHFDGNNHTLSNVTSAKSQSYQSIFGCLSGTLKNLKVDKAVMVAGTAHSGVVASHLGAGGTAMKSIVSNVTITNSTLGDANNMGTKKFGILAGVIENPMGAEISDITILDCSVASSADYVGAMVAMVSATTTISGTNTISRTNVYGSAAGGAIGYVKQPVTMSGTTCSDGVVVCTGNNAGGLLGYMEAASEITGCNVDMEVSGIQYVGGFVGTAVGNFTSNCSKGTVTGRTHIGGFAGRTLESKTCVFSKNYATGDVKITSSGSGKKNAAGLIGYIGGDMTMSDCYATGNVGQNTSSNAAQTSAGLVGLILDDATKVKQATITNCYASGDVVTYAVGSGLIGQIGVSSATVSGCVAWSETVLAQKCEATRYSSAAVVGVAYPNCTITNCYRNPKMNLTAYWVPAMDSFQHADVSAKHPLTDSTGAEMTDTATGSDQLHYPHYPYHGKVDAGRTLSALARDVLGWSPDIWDFTGDLPVLK